MDQDAPLPRTDSSDSTPTLNGDRLLEGAATRVEGSSVLRTPDSRREEFDTLTRTRPDSGEDSRSHRESPTGLLLRSDGVEKEVLSDSSQMCNPKGPFKSCVPDCHSLSIDFTCLCWECQRNSGLSEIFDVIRTTECGY